MRLCYTDVPKADKQRWRFLDCRTFQYLDLCNVIWMDDETHEVCCSRRPGVEDPLPPRRYPRVVILRERLLTLLNVLPDEDLRGEDLWSVPAPRELVYVRQEVKHG